MARTKGRKQVAKVRNDCQRQTDHLTRRTMQGIPRGVRAVHKIYKKFKIQRKAAVPGAETAIR